MVSALVLIECEKGVVTKTAEAIAEVEGVSEVYSLAGRIDLAAVVRVADNERLARVVTEGLRAIPGISRTETLFAFQVFSKHDLECMFSIGLEGE